MYVDYLSSFVSFVLLLIRILLYHLYKAEYIYIYMCVCVCVLCIGCIFNWRHDCRRKSFFGIWKIYACI